MVIRTHTEHSTPVYCYCDTNCFIASQQYYCSLHPLVEMLLYHNVSTGNLDLQGAILITWWATFMLKVWEMITLRPKPILPIKPILKVKTWILCEHAHTFDHATTKRSLWDGNKPSSTEPETKTLHDTSPEATYDIIELGWKRVEKVSKTLIC